MKEVVNFGGGVKTYSDPLLHIFRGGKTPNLRNIYTPGYGQELYYLFGPTDLFVKVCDTHAGSLI